MRPILSYLPLALCCITSCGGDLEGPNDPSQVPETLARRSDRVQEEWALTLRQAIEFGGLEYARTTLELQSDELGVEADLLRARLLTAEGADLEAQRAIERARRAAPRDVRVPATACELHSAHGRMESALQELKLAHELGGAMAEVHRAKGVHLLSQSGRAAEGLRELEVARELDPSLPFVDRAMAQAHLLLAKEHLGKGRSKDALRSVERSLHHDPQEFETRRLLSDVLLAEKRILDALVVLEELYAEGHSIIGELATMEKRAALVLLLQGEREDALDLFCKAREHGLGDDELGSGAQILAEAGMEALAAGVDAYEAGALDEARGRFERAVRLDPELLAAQNHLGVVCFRLGDNECAKRHWEVVWQAAVKEGLELPEPVEVNLARAMARLGELKQAEALLRASLEARPHGPHSDAARGFLQTELGPAIEALQKR
ncbi:MAG: tetratricopeptide repeat protein [Planctomycetes bacterium]|nr:tetratricopeptide repeat protein [Planctomycetota bacterium]